MIMEIGSDFSNIAEKCDMINLSAAGKKGELMEIYMECIQRMLGELDEADLRITRQLYTILKLYLEEKGRLEI